MACCSCSFFFARIWADFSTAESSLYSQDYKLDLPDLDPILGKNKQHYVFENITIAESTPSINFTPMTSYCI